MIYIKLKINQMNQKKIKKELNYKNNGIIKIESELNDKKILLVI